MTSVIALDSPVLALEAGQAAPPAAPNGGGLPDDSGEIGYQGTVRLHGEVQWTIRYSPAATSVLDPAGMTSVLAALGHPVRVAMLRQLSAGPARRGRAAGRRRPCPRPGRSTTTSGR